MDTVKSILKGDKYIWGVYLMLCMISIVEMYSATSTLTWWRSASALWIAIR